MEKGSEDGEEKEVETKKDEKVERLVEVEEAEESPDAGSEEPSRLSPDVSRFSAEPSRMSFYSDDASAEMLSISESEESSDDKDMKSAMEEPFNYVSCKIHGLVKVSSY